MPEILSGVSVNNYIKKYQPPFDEFEMDSCIIPVGETLEFPSIQGPSIMIVLEGKGYLLEIHSDNETYSIPLQSGDIFFIPAETHFQLTANLADFHCYRAGINSRAL
jgi:mannose-6-phosphate isomerase